jgi:flagellar protein FlaG
MRRIRGQGQVKVLKYSSEVSLETQRLASGLKEESIEKTPQASQKKADKAQVSEKGINKISSDNKPGAKPLVNEILKELKERLDPLSKVLKVEIDKDLKIPVFKIIDEDTKEVIRQIPWEEVLKLWKALKELLQKEGISSQEIKGLFLRKEV